jgi:hypothetical protein
VIGGGLGVGFFIGAATMMKIGELDTLTRLIPARIRTRIGMAL